MSKSKVDLSVFQEFASKYHQDSEICASFFYRLFSGEFDYFNLPYNWGDTKAERKAILAQYDYEWMDGQTGEEGEGEYCYGVIRFQGKYYKAEWSYYSYNGCEYDYIADTVKEVFPKEKTITVYE